MKAEDGIVVHHCDWIVVDWLEFSDTDHTYRKLTEFRPAVHILNRSVALRFLCTTCGAVKTAQEFMPNGSGSNSSYPATL